MPPVSRAMLERLGVAVLEELQPEALHCPRPIDLVELVDHQLPRHGVDVYPVRQEELGEIWAATDPEGRVGDRITILLAEKLDDDLRKGGPIAHMARATLAHEIAHAVLHVDFIRRRLVHPQGQNLLSRTKRHQLKPYEDPEWQAWMLGGCLLVPRTTLAMSSERSLEGLAETYQISVPMMRAHLKRLKLPSRAA